MLPLWREPNFQGSDPPKIGPDSDSERQRREKTQKIGSGAVSGGTFSAADVFLVDFWVPAGSHNEPKIDILIVMVSPRSANFFEVALRACLETFWDRSGRRRGRSGDPPGGFLEAFRRIFSRENTLQKQRQKSCATPWVNPHPQENQCWRTVPKIKNKLRGETLGKLFAGLAISGCGGLALAF